jgi:hypothetical protein
MRRYGVLGCRTLWGWCFKGCGFRVNFMLNVDRFGPVARVMFADSSDPIRSDKKALTHLQIKTTRRVPQVRRWNLVHGAVSSSRSFTSIAMGPTAPRWQNPQQLHCGSPDSHACSSTFLFSSNSAAVPPAYGLPGRRMSTPRPRFQQRTWGTLRLPILSREVQQ